MRGDRDRVGVRVVGAAAWAGVVAGALVASAGCATRSTHGAPGTAAPGSPEAAAAAAPESALGAALRKMADREARRPVESAKQAPAPEGVPDSAIAVVTADQLEKALTPPDEAVQAMVALLPDPRPPAPRLISDADAGEALRAYVSGRSARLAGDLDIALEELQRSAKLNPNPSEPWREIAEVQLARGDRHAAEQSFQRAFERDPTDPVVLERTALLPTEGAPGDATAGALGRLAEMEPETLDPAMQFLVPAGLGRVLADRGYLLAAAEYLMRAANLPSSFGATTNFREALSDLYRRRGELYRDAGDALMRLDRPGDALVMYTRGSMLPLLDPDAMLGRRVAALMRMGRPSAASMAVIGSIEARGGLVRESHVVLLRHIGKNSGAGPAIVEALKEDGARATPEVARATRTMRVRAIAALLPDDEARAYLREEVVAQGGDPELISDLYALLDPTDGAAREREAILLTALDPASVDRYVEAVIADGPDAAEVADRVRTVELTGPNAEEARALVRARVLVVMGEYAESLAVLDGVPRDGEIGAAGTIARIRVLLAMAEYDRARDELDAFDPGDSTPSVVAKAALLADQGRADEGLALVDGLAARADLYPWERAQAEVTAAKILTSAGRFPEAEARYRRVLEIEPANESAHAGLIALFVQGGALANESSLVDAIRSLRDSAPESRTFRVLRARDAVARNRPDLAEQELEELVERYPDDATIVALLVKVWRDQDRTDEAELWLREMVVRIPGNRAATIELARILVDTGRAREGADVLEKWLARSPADDAVSRFAEAVYRETLEDPGYASQLARQRLTRAPVSVDTLGELAWVLVQDGQNERAAEMVSRMVTLAESSGQMSAAANWGERIAQQIRIELDSQAIDPLSARRMLGDLAENVSGMGDAVHLIRMQVLGRSEVPVEEMIAAAELAGVKRPGLRDRVYDVLLSAVGSGSILRRAVNAEIEFDRGGVVRRPLNAPRATAEEEAAARRDRMALALPVIAHIRETRPAPIRASTEALAIEITTGLVFNGYTEAMPPLQFAIDETLTREDRDDVIGLWARLNADMFDTAVRSVLTKEQQAQAANSLSSILSFVGDEDRADDLARLALVYVPDDASAANNLGYRLLERNKDVDEAVRLIEMAYAAQPEQAHIIDSMAWARYKLGIVHNEYTPDGTLKTEGAVSLLRRALTIVQQAGQAGQGIESLLNRPVMLDHLGDAQWAAGDTDAAIASWRESLAFCENVLSPEQRRQFAMMNRSAVEELSKVVEGLRVKVNAVDAGEDPPIAKILRPVNSASDRESPPENGPLKVEPAPEPVPQGNVGADEIG